MARLISLNKSPTSLKLTLAPFTSPLLLVLILAGGLSFLLRDSIDGLIILGIAVASGLLGFFKEDNVRVHQH